MHVMTKKIRFLSRAFLALFVIANSGFTVVLERCTMAENTDSMQCCCGMDPGMCSDACGDTEGSVMKHGPVVEDSLPCRVVAVAGGLQDQPIILEQESTARHLVKSNPVSAHFVSPAPDGMGHTEYVRLSSGFSAVSPPSVGTYLFHSNLRL